MSAPSLPSLSLPTSPPSIPSFIPTSTPLFTSPPPIPFTFTSPPTLPTTPTLTPTPTPTPTTSSSSTSSTLVHSSSTSSSTSSTSSLTSTSSTPLAAGAIDQSPSSSASVSFATNANVPTTNPSSTTLVYTLSASTPSSTVASSSSSGFFSNTSAVAGTFTVVGLFSIAGVIAVALIIARRRRNSRFYEEDKEYLDKSPDLSVDPPMRQVTSLDDGSNSDHAHYGASPVALGTPPAAYYPDHAYAFHPQAYPPPQSQPYPVGYAQDWAAQNIYSPEDYDLVYSTQVPHVEANMPNPHQFTDVELDSAAAPQTQTALPNALRPSVTPTPSAPKQWASTRFSVDSFYTGIVTDHPTSPGQAL